MELADFVMEEGDITGATPSSNQARSNSSTPIVVSYRNPEIKQRVVRAAQAANIWNLQMPTENAKRKGNICSFKEVAVRRHSTKQSGRKTRETTTPLTDGGQQLIQPINNLMETLKTIQRKREEDEIEELLRRQETAPARDSATPVPSGDELTPSEANLDPDEEPDLREKLDKTRRERENLGEEPDLREVLVKTRRENEKATTVAPETALERGPGHEEREEGELAHQSSPTQTGQQATPNDPGECSTSSDESNKVNKFTPFRDEWEENSRLSPKTFPREWKTPKTQEDAQDGHLSPPSPLYQTEPASHEAATTTTTPTRASREPDHDDLEMLARVPSTSGTQRKKKAHSPIIYRNCHTHVNTPRISVWDRMGQRNEPSVKRRLDWQHV
jgi:hypothetical protein